MADGSIQQTTNDLRTQTQERNPMPYPYNDDDGNDYYYGLNEQQIRAKLEHAINGEDDDDIELDFGDLNDDDPDDDE